MERIQINIPMTTKQDIISRVMSATMHILHDSHLNGSDLWPEHGFKAGISRDWEKISDVIDIYVGISHYKLTDTYYQGMHFNIMNILHKRSLDQAKCLDDIFDKAIYDNVYFECSLNSRVPDHFRFSSRGIVRSNIQYIQLPFTFTLNN